VGQWLASVPTVDERDEMDGWTGERRQSEEACRSKGRGEAEKKR